MLDCSYPQLENKVAAIVTRAAVRIQKLVRGKLSRKKFASMKPELKAKRDKLQLRLQREANIARKEKENQEARRRSSEAEAQRQEAEKR